MSTFSSKISVWNDFSERSVRNLTVSEGESNGVDTISGLFLDISVNFGVFVFNLEFRMVEELLHLGGLGL